MERQYKKTKLQQNKVKQYTLTIPKWIVENVLNAEKGDFIAFNFFKGKIVLEKIE